MSTTLRIPKNNEQAYSSPDIEEADITTEPDEPTTPTRTIQDLELYYQPDSNKYFRRDVNENFIKIDKESAILYIKQQGFGAGAAKDISLMYVQTHNNIAYAGPLAGYSAGIYTQDGKRILVTTSPKIIVGEQGDFPLITSLLNNMFKLEDVDQRPYFYGWLKSARLSITSSTWCASQLLALCGPAGSGKSLLQNLITKILGGRTGKPYTFMTGVTAFNSNMFGAEHQMLEDESESIDIRARKHFAAQIKACLANKIQIYHGKGKDALSLEPIWRMTISLNDEPERLMILPPLDADIKDKLMLLKVKQSNLNENNDPEYWDKLLAELPAFIYFIENYQIPSALKGSQIRYAIQAYQHPDLVKGVEDTSPESRLLEMIDQELLRDENEWKGRSTKLAEELNHDKSSVAFESRKLLSWTNAAGTYLSRLASRNNSRVSKKTRDGYTIWTITK